MTNNERIKIIIILLIGKRLSLDILLNKIVFNYLLKINYMAFNKLPFPLLNMWAQPSN